MIATYVDDCKQDAAKVLQKLVWKAIRLIVESTQPKNSEDFLGMGCSPA